MFLPHNLQFTLPTLVLPLPFRLPPHVLRVARLRFQARWIAELRLIHLCLILLTSLLPIFHVSTLYVSAIAYGFFVAATSACTSFAIRV